MQWVSLITGATMVCIIALSAHVYVVSALKVSAHLLSLRLERAAGCDQDQTMDAAGRGVRSTVGAYIHVCIDAPGPTTRRGYVLMLDLE
jgi:hypothetical protein